METQGQLLPDSLRGQSIIEIISKNQPNTILEIGTWKGLGSTLCILQSMKDDSKFISLESDLSMYEIAKVNLDNFLNKFKMVYGTISSTDDINDFVKDLSLDSQKQRWLEYDLTNVNKCPNVLNIIPDSIDFLLLDGGEFSTYSEWTKLRDRTKIVAMDDISQIKTNRIYNELSNDSRYKLLTIINEGNGFAIFEKIN